MNRIIRLYSYGLVYTVQLTDEEKKLIGEAILNEDTLALLSEYIMKHSLTDYHFDRDKNEIIAHYDISEDSKLMLPIPAYDNWKVSIDGIDTGFDDSAGGLTIVVPAGKHEVKVKYVQDSVLPYFIISLVSFVIFMGAMIVISKKSVKE